MTPETDIHTIRLVILCAVSIAIGSLIAGIVLIYLSGRGQANTTQTAVIFGSIGVLLAQPGACLTGLFGLLAKTSTTAHPGAPGTPGGIPLNVSVDQSNADPIPTHETPIPAPALVADAVTDPATATDPPTTPGS